MPVNSILTNWKDSLQPPQGYMTVSTLTPAEGEQSITLSALITSLNVQQLTDITAAQPLSSFISNLDSQLSDGNVLNLTYLEYDSINTPPQYIYFTIQASSGISFSLIPDILKISGMGFSLGISTPYTDLMGNYHSGLFGQVFATLNLFSYIDDTGASQTVDLQAILDFSDFSLTASLTNPIKVKYFLSEYSIPVPSILETVILSSLVAYGNYTTKTLLLNINIGSHISLLPSSDALQLTQLGLSIQKIGGTNPSSSATITGTLTLKGVAAEGNDLDIILTASNSASSDNSNWRFTGSTGNNQQIPIGSLINSLAQSIGDIQLPHAITDFTISYIFASYDLSTKNFSFSCKGQLPLGDGSMNMSLQIVLTKQDDNSYQKDFSGLITAGSYVFEVEFASSPTETNFIALFRNDDEEPIHIQEIIGGLSPTVAEYIPPSLAINLKDIFFVYHKEAQTKTSAKTTQTKGGFLLGTDLSASLDLTQIPVAGALIPADQNIAIENLKLFVASTNFNAEQLESFNTQLSSHQIPEFPTTPAESKNGDSQTTKTTQPTILPKGWGLAAEVQIGPKEKTLMISTGSTKKPPKKTTSKGKTTPTTTTTSTTTSMPTTTDSSQYTTDQSSKIPGVQWFNIQKSAGPLYFGRIGVRFEDGELTFLLDAAMKVGPLNVSLDGLSLSSPIDHFEPHFALYGLSLDYKQPPIEIGGAFLKAIPTPEGVQYEYDGMLVIKAKKISFTAIGSYAKLLTGKPSIFAYVAIGFPLGGPPWFLVKGLSFGFGYNRALLPPPLQEMDSFPLVAEVLYSGGKATTPQKGKTNTNSAQQKANLMAELEKLKQYIPPEAGQYFIAVGLMFSTFEVVNSFALATVQFGNRFRIDLFGRMFFLHPPVGMAQRNTKAPLLVNIEIDLIASLVPDEGYFELRAAIKEGSYIYSSNCKISGNLAFKAWFAGDHAGDFVFVLGGYHPKFYVPSYYPTREWLKPLSLWYGISEKIYIKGAFYLALTPVAFMAGGDLEANFEGDIKIVSLKAYFHLYADFIIYWKPFHYDISIGVDISIKASVHFLVTVSISLNLHADLHIWGPELSGKANVEILGISISIAFGADAPQYSPPIPWPEFQTSFLPDTQKICSTLCAHGLLKEVTDTDGTPYLIINRKTFSIEFNSVIPLTAAYLHTTDMEEDENALIANGTPFGINPMHINHGNLQSELQISLTGPDVDYDSFAFVPILKNVPAGLWGDYKGADLNQDRTIPNILSGFSIEPGSPPKPSETHEVPKENLQYDSYEVQQAFNWESPLNQKIYPTTPQSLIAGMALPHNYSQMLQGLLPQTDLENLLLAEENTDLTFIQNQVNAFVYTPQTN